MKSDEKRQTRINTLLRRAYYKKYTWSGQFHYDALVNDAMTMRVCRDTARGYADAVILRLKKGKHVK